MNRVLILVFLILIACHSKETRNEKVDISERLYSETLTNRTQRMSVASASFSDKGIFLGENTPSYVKIDSIPLNWNEDVNLSMWFQFQGRDGRIAQMLFSAQDSMGVSIDFYIAGRRITGKVGNQHLWAKDYDYTKGRTTLSYDIYPLEIGKFYFASFNFRNSSVEVVINGEQYAFYNNVTIPLQDGNVLFLGSKKEISGDFKYQFEGNIRNLTIFNKALNFSEIEALGKETFDEIHPYNDAFELSKFNLDSGEK